MFQAGFAAGIKAFKVKTGDFYTTLPLDLHAKDDFASTCSHTQQAATTVRMLELFSWHFPEKSF